jgi:hypothetical protein
VPKKEALKKKILDEAHTSRYSIHPRSTKMSHDLRQQFWWTRMKHEAAHYVSMCDTYRKVKADYMKPGGLLQPLSIPKWNWNDISMDIDAEQHSIGLSRERMLSLDLTLWKKLKRPFVVSKITQNPQNHAKKRCLPLEFKVGDHVYFRVSPMKGAKRFRVKGKLVPLYIIPFPILEKCGIVAYMLDLPPSLAGVHDIFHMSQLKKCLKAPVDVMLLEVTPLEANFSYPKHPIKSLD